MKFKTLLISAISMSLLFSQVISAQNATNPAFPGNYQFEKGQPNGQHQQNGNHQANGVLASDEFIFGYSGGSATMLELNGIIISNYSGGKFMSGWYSNTGQHVFGNDNWICGRISQYYSPDDGYFRNYFAFNLDNLASHGITPPITSASLKVAQRLSEPPSGYQLFELFQVTTSYQNLNADFPSGSSEGIDYYTDLGSGPSYGSYNVDRTMPEEYLIVIPLNAAALADINSTIGSIFVIGGKADSTAAPVETPVSGWAPGIGIALILIVAVLRFRRIL